MRSEAQLLEEYRQKPTCALTGVLSKAMEGVRKVATHSGNLKGTFQKLLWTQTEITNAAATALYERVATLENASANASANAELDS